MTKQPKSTDDGGAEPLAPELAALPEVLRPGVARQWQRFCENATEQGVTRPTHRGFLRVLTRVWAASEFVAETCVREPALLAELLDRGDLLRDYSAADYPDRLRTAVARSKDDDGLGTALRAVRRREMVRIVWRDLAGWAGLGETLLDLSRLADACVAGALRKLDGWMRKEYGSPRAADGQPQGLVVLAMGKLGALELNVSSDIDLIFAYPEQGMSRRRRGITTEEFFTRLAQRLIRVIGETTAEGFVFRVDARLRPYGDSGPLVMSFDAMEEYYQSQGREWERYAMIKARVLAGDRGAVLLSALRPFVYRRYLDFGAFESLRDMKALIQRQVQRKGMEGNIKLGPGGIREIEFIGQAFQLIRGGREPALRERGILTVLHRLAAANYLPRYVADSLMHAYVFLRRVENRLQAYADAQVHTLPEHDTERLRLAFAMGYPDWARFAAELAKQMGAVHEHFEHVFAAPQAAKADAQDTLEAALGAAWQGSIDLNQAGAALAEAGFDDPLEALRLIQRVRDGHACRGLGNRGRERLDRLMPMLLAAVAAGERSTATLLRVLGVIEAVAGRTAYLALLTENPMALSQLVKLCAASPWIAQQLAQHPLLLDDLLDPRTLYLPLHRDGLRAELADALAALDADDLEQQMELLRHFKQSNSLRVAAADVAEVMPLMVVSDHLTEIAEVVVDAVLSLCWQMLVRRHGRPMRVGPGKALPAGFAVIAYGKLGGLELGYGSDLDLVFLHDSSAEGGHTDGAQPVDNSVFFGRLGQRIIHVLNTLTPSGVLYEVDMRLRPSGASGLLVSNIDAFADYQRTEAWTWEHQALVRARAIAGDTGVAAQFHAIRLEILARERDAETLRREVRDMRERMRRELSAGDGDQFDLKQGRGGLTDIEFLVQYAVLRWTREHPDLAEFTDNIRQLEAFARADLMPLTQARLLADAYRSYRRRIHRLALDEEPPVVPRSEFHDCRRQVTKLWRAWIGE